MNDYEWIKNLKVGDEVVVSGSFYESITTVKAITPKGFIRTEDNFLYNQFGNLKSSEKWSRGHIEPLTQEFLEKAKAKALINKCRSLFARVNLTGLQAEKIIEILEGKE